MSNRSDNFNRADNAASLGTPSDGGSAWAAITGTWGIATNQAYNPSGTNSAVAVLDSGTSDVDVQATFPNFGVGIDGRVVARLADASNYLMVRGRPSQGYDLYENVAGTFTALFSGAGTVANGDTVKLSCSGSTIKVYLNGTQIGTTQTVTAGQANTKHGIGGNSDATIRLDNFSVTDTGPGGSSGFTDAAGTSISGLASNHGAGTVTVKAVASGVTYAAGNTWTVSGVTGWSLNTATFVDGTHYTLLLNCPAAATPPAGATGTLTIANTTVSASGTLAVATPTLALSPTSGGIGTTPTLTLTGVRTLWADETAAGLFTVAGGAGASIGTPTVAINTGAAATLTAGSASGTLTVTDTSTGATAAFAVRRAATTFYVDPVGGSDSNNGTATGTPWQTMTKANSGPSGGYVPGDALLFKGGTTTSGNLAWATSGTQAARCTIGGYGTGNATISCGTGTGVLVTDAEFVTVQGLAITGAGVSSADGTTTSTGWAIRFHDDRTSGSKLRSIRVAGCTVTGTKGGIRIDTPTPDTAPSAVVGFEDVRVTGCTVHDIQTDGIVTLGGTAWEQIPPYNNPADLGVFKGVYVGSNVLYNVFGSAGVYDRTMWLDNVSGGLAERNVIHNCGLRSSSVSDNAQIMWFASDRGVTQYNEVYGCTGGSVLDIDLLCTACIIQYNYTHDNDGAGLMDYGTGSYAGHIIRFNVSRNDNGDQDGGSFRAANAGLYHNNTIISDAAIQSGTAPLVALQGNCTFANNVLVGNGGLKLIAILAGMTPAIAGNLYYTGNPSTANFDGAITTLAAWRAAGHETVDGQTFGVVGDPLLSSPSAGAGTGTLPAAQVATVTAYDPASGSPAVGAGCPPELLDLAFGPADFHGYPCRTGAAPDAGAVSYGASSLLPPAGGTAVFPPIGCGFIRGI